MKLRMLEADKKVQEDLSCKVYIGCILSGYQDTYVSLDRDAGDALLPVKKVCGESLHLHGYVVLLDVLTCLARINSTAQW